MTAFVVLFVLCQSPVRNLGRDRAQEPSFPTGPATTPPSLSSCGWLCQTPSSSCATTRLAAATTASLAVECRPIRPVRAATPRTTIRTTTTTGTTTTILAKRRRILLKSTGQERRPGAGSPGPTVISRPGHVVSPRLGRHQVTATDGVTLSDGEGLGERAQSRRSGTSWRATKMVVPGARERMFCHVAIRMPCSRSLACCPSTSWAPR
jgi:hypothetical protein